MPRQAANIDKRMCFFNRTWQCKNPSASNCGFYSLQIISPTHVFSFSSVHRGIASWYSCGADAFCGVMKNRRHSYGGSLKHHKSMAAPKNAQQRILESLRTQTGNYLGGKLGRLIKFELGGLPSKT